MELNTYIYHIQTSFFVMFEIFLDGAKDGNSKRVLVSVSYNAILKS